MQHLHEVGKMKARLSISYHVCGPPNFTGRGHPRFWTCTFKYSSLPNMLHTLVELCSV